MGLRPLYICFPLAVWGSTTDVRIWRHRRQTLTSIVDPRAVRVKVVIAPISVLAFLLGLQKIYKKNEHYIYKVGMPLIIFTLIKLWVATRNSKWGGGNMKTHNYDKGAFRVIHPPKNSWFWVSLLAPCSHAPRMFLFSLLGARNDFKSHRCTYSPQKVQIYSLTSSLETYDPTLHFTPWYLGRFIRVSFQLHGEHTVLPPFRWIELIIHIAISVLSCTHLGCLSRRHDIETMSKDWEREIWYSSEKPALSRFETARQ